MSMNAYLILNVRPLPPPPSNRFDKVTPLAITCSSRPDVEFYSVRECTYIHTLYNVQLINLICTNVCVQLYMFVSGMLALVVFNLPDSHDFNTNFTKLALPIAMTGTPKPRLDPKHFSFVCDAAATSVRNNRLIETKCRCAVFVAFVLILRAVVIRYRSGRKPPGAT